MQPLLEGMKGAGGRRGKFAAGAAKAFNAEPKALVRDCNLRKISKAKQRNMAGREKFGAHRDGRVRRCQHKTQRIVKEIPDGLPR